MKNSTIGIIGAGNMGSALYRALLKQFPRRDLHITDHDSNKVRALGVKKTLTLKQMVSACNVVIIAVKPQSFTELCTELSGALAGKLVISILAGTTMKNLTEQTRATKIVRTMPNLPVAVGSGVTLWVATKTIRQDEKTVIRKILTAGGIAVELASEKQLAHLTAIPGCGPAYFYYLTELMANEARRFGLNEKNANELAAATFIGAAKLLAENTKTPKEWRAAVTSKRGVTEAALKELRRKKVPEIFHGAIKKAVERTIQLSN